MTSALKPKKVTFKKMESEWYNYYDTLREIAALRQEIIDPYQEEDSNIGGSDSGKNGSPTEMIATRLTTNKQLDYLTTITEAIEKVYNALPDEYRRLVQVRYWSKQSKTWEKIADECYVSRRQAMRWRDEIIQATMEVLGWR